MLLLKWLRAIALLGQISYCCKEIMFEVLNDGATPCNSIRLLYKIHISPSKIDIYMYIFTRIMTGPQIGALCLCYIMQHRTVALTVCWLVLVLRPSNIQGHMRTENRLVTVRTHGDFTVLPHLQIRLPPYGMSMPAPSVSASMWHFRRLKAILPKGPLLLLVVELCIYIYMHIYVYISV